MWRIFIYLGVCWGLGGKLRLPWFNDDTMAGIAKLLAELTRFIPCEINSLKLCRCWSCFVRGSSISSKSSISPSPASVSVTLNSTADGAIVLCCNAAAASTGPHIVDAWHLFMHFLWQFIAQSRQWTPSFSQIFRPQKSHWVDDWKCFRWKLCCRETLASVLSTSSFSALDDSLELKGECLIFVLLFLKLIFVLLKRFRSLDRIGACGWGVASSPREWH